MHLLEQDIEGNPNDGDTGCKDKLIVKSTDLAEDLTTCGSLPYTRPATKIYNSVYSKVPNVFFSSDDMESSSFKILLVYLSRKVCLHFPLLGTRVYASLDCGIDFI